MQYHPAIGDSKQPTRLAIIPGNPGVPQYYSAQNVLCAELAEQEASVQF